MQEESHKGIIAYNEEDINALLNNTITELTTLLEIKNCYAAFNATTKPAHLEKIALYIKPFHNTPLELTSLTVILHTPQDIFFITPTQQTTDIANTLFKNTLWNQTPPAHYSIISLNDHDSSLKNQFLINSHTDTFYLIFTLPEDVNLNGGDQFSILLLPSQGQQNKIELEIPLPINQVVQLLRC